MDEHCKLDTDEVFQDYNCLLNFVDEKSDCIQVLKNDKGFHVWTRWGRNGTDVQSKVEGPTSRADAKKNFRKKFMDKTKNNWDKHQQFTPVKGKYTLVVKTDESQAVQKPELAAECSSKVQLSVEILYIILSQLCVRDVLRCMQVCKNWKMSLSDKYFWKKYIQKHFDLGIKSDLSNEGPMAQWSGHAWTERSNRRNFRDDETWFCYFEDDINDDDIYVMRPFPSMWDCGVFHPHGLDPISGDVRSLQGFCRSLEILTFMRNEAYRLIMLSGSQCSGSEGEDEICAVLFPWDKKQLPTPLELLNGVFHFHPEVYDYYTCCPEYKGNLEINKLHFHIRPDDRIDDSDYDEETEEGHDLEEKPCLNRIFGMGIPDDVDDLQDSRKFYEWLQPIMCPSVFVYAGYQKMNPVAIFMLTQLAPGWVGGALTGNTY